MEVKQGKIAPAGGRRRMSFRFSSRSSRSVMVAEATSMLRYGSVG
jgi:hypothetical protein